jgi:hypothetical protein
VCSPLLSLFLSHTTLLPSAFRLSPIWNWFEMTAGYQSIMFSFPESDRKSEPGAATRALRGGKGAGHGLEATHIGVLSSRSPLDVC